MKYPYTVKFNGKKYFPGEDVPIETENTETVAVTEEVAVTETVEEPVEDIAVDEPKSVLTKKADTEKKKGGRKPKA